MICINIKDNVDCMTALLQACFYGHKAVVELLVQNGADVNYQNRVKLMCVNVHQLMNACQSLLAIHKDNAQCASLACSNILLC